jgi:hypothetical protein
MKKVSYTFFSVFISTFGSYIYIYIYTCMQNRDREIVVEFDWHARIVSFCHWAIDLSKSRGLNDPKKIFFDQRKKNIRRINHMSSRNNFRSFSEFYPFYLTEHSNAMNRLLHFVGTSSVLVLLLVLFITGQWLLLPLMIVVGYGFAWFGHFVFEKNKPATFRYPIYSFLSDWVMWFEILTGKRTFDSKNDK